MKEIKENKQGEYKRYVTAPNDQEEKKIKRNWRKLCHSILYKRVG